MGQISIVTVEQGAHVAFQNALCITTAAKAGMVEVNRDMVSNSPAPFGDVRHSGIGRKGAWKGLREYQEMQYPSVEPFTRPSGNEEEPDVKV